MSRSDITPVSVELKTTSLKKNVCKHRENTSGPAAIAGSSSVLDS